MPASSDILLPEDPTADDSSTSILSLLADTGSAITVPWPKRLNPLIQSTVGCGIRTTKLITNDDIEAAIEKTALSSQSLDKSLKLRYEPAAKSTFHKAITSNHANSYEHINVTGSASVGGKFVKGTATGKYNKQMTENSDALKASLQATIRMGTVYIDGPRLSLDAIADVRRPRMGPATPFKDLYGDYYVGILQLGAEAGVLVSNASQHKTESESSKVQGKLKIFWSTVEKTLHDESSYSEEQWGDFSVIAFDTLTGTNVDSQSQGEAPHNVARDFLARVQGLESRAQQKMDELGLHDDGAVNLESCRKLCESGLVVEVVLLPYAKLRDYVRASLESI